MSRRQALYGGHGFDAKLCVRRYRNAKQSYQKLKQPSYSLHDSYPPLAENLAPTAWSQVSFAHSLAEGLDIVLAEFGNKSRYRHSGAAGPCKKQSKKLKLCYFFVGPLCRGHSLVVWMLEFSKKQKNSMTRMATPTPFGTSTCAPSVAPQSSYRYQNIVTSDSEHHAACLSDWEQTYNQLEGGRFSGELIDIGFSGVQVFRESTNRSVFQNGSPKADCVVIGITVGMEGQGLFSGKQFGPADLIMFNGSQGFSLVTPKRFDVLAVTVPRLELLQLLALEGIDTSALSNSILVKPSSDALNSLKRCLLEILSPGLQSASSLGYSQVQRVYKSALLSTTVNAIRSSHPVDEPSRCFRSRSHLVRTIVDWVMSRRDDPPTIYEICLKFNVGRRVLNYSFVEVVGSSPLNFLRSMRLNGARRDLRKQGRNQSVQEIAGRWGFCHMPRFSTEYRKLFGELPSQTRQQAS